MIAFVRSLLCTCAYWPHGAYPGRMVYITFLSIHVEPIMRVGSGAMARARSFANVAACRAVSNPAWCRNFRIISFFSPLNIWALFLCCVLGQGTLPSHASLDWGVNEYLVVQIWQCV